MYNKLWFASFPLNFSSADMTFVHTLSFPIYQHFSFFYLMLFLHHNKEIFSFIYYTLFLLENSWLSDMFLFAHNLIYPSSQKQKTPRMWGLILFKRLNSTTTTSTIFPSPNLINFKTIKNPIQFYT